MVAADRERREDPVLLLLVVQIISLLMVVAAALKEEMEADMQLEEQAVDILESLVIRGITEEMGDEAIEAIVVKLAGECMCPEAEAVVVQEVPAMVMEEQMESLIIEVFGMVGALGILLLAADPNQREVALEVMEVIVTRQVLCLEEISRVLQAVAHTAAVAAAVQKDILEMRTTQADRELQVQYGLRIRH